MMAECFIIMPITTPADFLPRFNGDKAHFEHTLDHLFKPAVEDAGFEPISPIAYGADLIHAEIIRHLESSELVLCDISCTNPNVFFELGIRTAVDKPVALVRDNFTTDIPFDTSIVNFHTYDASLAPWLLPMEVKKLSSHIKASSKRSKGRNPLWRYFGLTTRGAFRPEESPLEAKIDLVLHQLRDVAERTQAGYIEESESARTAPRPTRGRPPARDEDSARDILSTKVVPELQAIASSMGVDYRGLRKADLIDAIIAKAEGLEYEAPQR
jgi:Rho termination factor, N-terminal domain